jgi:zinc protease
MTAAQMKSMAQKYLKPEKMNILLVADKQRVIEKVKKLGYEVVELDADGNRIGDKKVF